jgi:hypothetical protein
MPNAFHDFDGLMMKDICKIIYPLEFSAPRNIYSDSNPKRHGPAIVNQ